MDGSVMFIKLKRLYQSDFDRKLLKKE